MSDGNSHFLMALGRHDGGSVVETADEQLREVISAVNRTGGKGSVSITINVAPNGDRGLEVSLTVAAKAPKVDFGKAFYFTGKDGDLSRTPPPYVQETLLREGV